MTKDNNKLIEKLHDLGLSQRESKVYLALLKNGTASASSIQDASGIPRTKVYEITKSLVQKGYCKARRTGRELTFDTIDPQTAFGTQIPKIEDKLTQTKNTITELHEIFSNSGRYSESLEYVEILHGNEIVHNHYCELVNDAKREILGFGRGPYAWDSSTKLEEQKQALLGLLERGGHSRWVFEVTGEPTKWMLDYFEVLRENDIPTRISKSLPLKMMIFDQQAVLVAQEDHFNIEGDLTMSIIKQSTIANAFTALFEYFWAQSVDYESWLKSRNN